MNAAIGNGCLQGKVMQSTSTTPLVPPGCELCRGAMKLDRTQPHLGPHPELLTFRCQQCGHVVTIAADEER